MERRQFRRGRSRDELSETELSPLVRNDVSRSYTNMTEEQDQSDETFTDVAGPSTSSTEKLRLMVLGGDDALLDKACGTILRKKKKKKEFKFGKLEPRSDHVCGRQVSVLKTPFSWLEHLKSYLYLFFNRGVRAIKTDIESYESKLFPGPHAFLLVHRDVKNSGRDYYLLKALSEVFGTEVLDYCMVLFLDSAKHDDPNKNPSLRMCGNRHHVLQNTDESVNQLFRKIKTMGDDQRKEFFTRHFECFKKAEVYFLTEYEEKEHQLRKVLREREQSLEEENVKLQSQLDQLKDVEKQLQNNLHEREREMQKRLEDLDDRETHLNEREKELEIRQRKLTQRDAGSSEHPSVSEKKDRLLPEGASRSRDGSQAGKSPGIEKPVRRNSMGKNPPYMS